jgi:hypothetical protein
VGWLSVGSPVRFFWQIGDRKIALEADRNYKLSSVSLVLLKGTGSAGPNIPLNNGSPF